MAFQDFKRIKKFGSVDANKVSQSHLQIEWWKEPKPQTDLELLKIKQVSNIKKAYFVKKIVSPLEL